LVVWDAKTGDKKCGLVWTNTAKDGPNSIMFSDNEQFVANQPSKNVINIFSDGDLSKPKYEIVAKPPKTGVKALVSIPADKCRFDGLRFAPCVEASDQVFLLAWQNGEVLSENEDTGIVHVYDFSKTLDHPKFSVSCPRGQNIQILPQPTGHSFLIWGQNLNDSTGKSYYGEHNLQFVRLVGGAKTVVVPAFDNQIQDVQWTSDGNQFIVVSGQQPATSTMYNSQAQPLFEFGKRFRNTIRLCPFSQTIVIGGFGNITKGEMDFWDLKSEKELGSNKSPCATKILWSACGKYLLTCVLYERLKVDNGFKIFRANGTKLLPKAQAFKELYNLEWQPMPLGTFTQPDVKKMLKTEPQDQNAKPKRIFKFGAGGGSSAF
jgi:uncharacterized protein with WD repeat